MMTVTQSEYIFNSVISPAIPRPALVVHIDNRLKIGHCFMMSCMPKCSAYAVPIEDMS